jgi:hypothetical protein
MPPVLLRPLLVAALALPVVPVTAAQAKAPKVSCNLLTDDKADSFPVPDDALEVVSADIASDAKKITGVIRLAGAPGKTDPTAPGGRVYSIQFTGQDGDHPVELSYLVAPTGSGAVHGHWDPTTGTFSVDGDASVKLVGNEIRLTTPINSFSAYGKFKPKARIDGLTVVVGRMIGAFLDSQDFAYEAPTADQATSDKVYVAGSKSCVKVGG